MTATMAGTRSAHHRRMTWLWRTVAVVFIAITVFPVYWMVNSSFEPNGQITSLTPSFFPVHFTFQNFVSAVDRPYFWTDARNSLIVVVLGRSPRARGGLPGCDGGDPVPLRGGKAFLVLILVVQMVPTTALVIPMFLILDKAKLIDSFPGADLDLHGADAAVYDLDVAWVCERASPSTWKKRRWWTAATGWGPSGVSFCRWCCQDSSQPVSLPLSRHGTTSSSPT